MNNTTAIMKEVKKILTLFEDKYVIQDVINKSKVIQDLDEYKEDLVEAMLSNEIIKNQFVIEIQNISVFKVNQLIEIFQTSDYWMDSYTKYTKKIGLTVNNNFLDERTNVMLDFPYKDTVLKATMSKEEKEHEDLLPNEPFLNEVIAKEEIDVLLDKKILINAKKYDRNGEHEASEFTFDDNLILKGNNLLALHTIKDLYAGKVKLIYIDPPYNTGNDSFAYNDNFNHASWLTFMKNRLEIAKELLSEDGYIVIQTDDSEQAYLKVLMDSDQLFGRENYVNTVSVLFKNIAGASGGGEDKRLKKNIEYLTIYAKNYEQATPFNTIYKYIPIHELVEQMRNDGVSWKYTSVLVNPGEKHYVGSTVDGAGDEIKIFKRINHKISSISSLMKEKSLTEEQAYAKFGQYAFQTAMPQSSIRPRVMEKYRELEDNPAELISIEYTPKSGKNKGNVYEQFYKGKNFRLFAWLRDVSEERDGILHKKEKLGTFWDYVGETKNVNKEGQVIFNNGKKPERSLGNIIELTTNTGDIVLDFFMGSASTQATALKLGRKFIGLEQMDYINTLSIPRLVNAIKGDRNGVSADVDWQGGGSFIYAELMEKNQGFLKTIINAKEIEELKKVFQFMLKTGDFDFQVDLNEVSQTLWDLPLEKQKRALIKIIDKNQLYFNFSEIDDNNVKNFISENDYKFNKTFYNKRGE